MGKLSAQAEKRIQTARAAVEREARVLVRLIGDQPELAALAAALDRLDQVVAEEIGVELGVR